MIKLEKQVAKVRQLRAVELDDTTYGPMLQLGDGLNNPWNFGVVKARMIVEAVDAIREFATKHKDYVASTGSKRKDETELSIEEQKAHQKFLLGQLAKLTK